MSKRNWNARNNNLRKRTQRKKRCTFYTSETLRKLISYPKDRVPTEKRNNVVYQINCQDCSAAYIGETKRSFNQRSKEHQRAITNCDTEKNEIAFHQQHFIQSSAYLVTSVKKEP